VGGGGIRGKRELGGGLGEGEVRGKVEVTDRGEEGYLGSLCEV
jgi:hypothetical protein